MRKRFLVHLFILVIALSILLTGCSQKTALTLDLKDGSKYETTITVNQTMVQEMEGEKITSTSDFVMGCSIDSKGKDEEGNQKAELGYTKLSMTIGMPELGLQMKFDTADENSKNEVTDMLRKLISKKFTITVSPEGEIVKFEGLDDLLKEFVDESELDDMELEEALASLNGFLSEDSIRETFETSSWISSPEDEELKVGTTWTETLSTTIEEMPIELEAKYTIKEIKGSKVTLTVESTIELTEGSILEAEEGFGMEYSLEGSQSGELVVDLDTGLVMNGKVTTNFTGNMSMDMDIITFDIPFEADQVMKIETVKK